LTAFADRRSSVLVGRWPTTAVLFAGLVALYATVAPSLLHHHWDSLEYAYACEATLSKRVWGNHPLGHVVLCGAYRGAVALGYSGRALDFMSAFNAVVGAAAVIAMVGLLVSIGVARARAVAWSLTLAGMYGFWLYASTADVYAISLLAQIGGWWALLRAAEAPGTRRAVIAALAVGTAVVAHQFNGPLLVAACAGLVPFARGPRRPAMRHVFILGAVSIAVAAVGYYVIGIWSTGTTDVQALERWLIGYGADETYGRSANFAGVAKALGTSSQTLLKVPYSVPLLSVWASLLALLAAPALLGLGLVRWTPARFRPALVSALGQLAVGAPLITWWAPYHIGKWWLLMLPAFVVVQASGVESLARMLGERLAPRMGRILNASVAMLASATLLLTGLVTMRSLVRVDEAFERTLQTWASNTRKEDVIIQGDVTAHLLFWAGRPNSLFLYRTVQAGGRSAPFSVLERVIDTAHRNGHAVYYVPGTIESLNPADLALVGVTREELLTFLDRYPRAGPLFQVQPRAELPLKDVFSLTRRVSSATGSVPLAEVDSGRSAR
jgi:hypothetical protein